VRGGRESADAGWILRLMTDAAAEAIKSERCLGTWHMVNPESVHSHRRSLHHANTFLFEFNFSILALSLR